MLLCDPFSFPLLSSSASIFNRFYIQRPKIKPSVGRSCRPRSGPNRCGSDSVSCATKSPATPLEPINQPSNNLIINLIINLISWLWRVSEWFFWTWCGSECKVSINWFSLWADVRNWTRGLSGRPVLKGKVHLFHLSFKLDFILVSNMLTSVLYLPFIFN